MDSINKVKSISIWIFIIPFVAVNTCLILITTFHDLFPNKEDVLIGFIFPYLDGGASISRTARVFPAMEFLTTSNKKGLGDKVEMFDNGTLNAEGKDEIGRASCRERV